ELRSCLVKANIIEGCGQGIVFDGKGAADSISIENNQLFDIAATLNEERSAPTAIRVLRARHAEVAGNVVRGVGVQNVQGILRAGIIAAACESVRVAGNEVTQVGPAGPFVGTAAAVQIVRPFQQATVCANTLRREASAEGIRSEWSAIAIGGALDRTVDRIARDTFIFRLDENRLLL